MKISTKGRYALRLMLDLAMSESDEPVRVREIAGRQEISDKYLEQIISILSKAGYVKSIRGPQGGYRLMRPAHSYTVGSILRLTEGNLSPVACLEDETNLCTRKEECMTLPLWKKIEEAVRDVVDHVTLQDLIDWHYHKQSDNYVI